MILQWIIYYYKFVILLVILVVVAKLFLTYLYYGSLGGFLGAFFTIFRWYNQDLQDAADSETLVKYMRIQNFLSLVMYLSFAYILAYHLVIFLVG